MSRRKFYQSRLMLRAGRPLTVLRAPFSALHVRPDGTVRVIASTDACALCRDHAGWPKAFAIAVGDIPPHRLVIYQCELRQANAAARALEARSAPPPSTSFLPLGFAIAGNPR